MTKLELYLIALFVLLASLGGMWFFAKHEGRLEERAVWESKQAQATKKDLESLTQAVGMANQIAQDTADKLSKAKGQRVIDRGVISREIQNNVVYANDCLPPTGRLQWDALSKSGTVLPDSGSVQQPDHAMPSANGPATTGRQSWVAPAKPSGVPANIR